MTKKERFDSIAILYKKAWDNFNERRKYENKFSFGVYTIYAISISGILVTVDKNKIKDSFLVGVAIIGGLIFLLHLIWLKGANKANFIDRKIALHHENIMLDLSDSNYKKKFKRALLSNNFMAGNKTPSFCSNWSLMIQAGISLTLYIALIIITAIVLDMI